MYKRLGEFFISIVMLFSAFFFGCNKTTDIGINLIPDGDLIKVDLQDTLRIFAYSDRIDSLVAYKKGDSTTTGINHPKVLFGNYTDPIFGELNASFITEIYPTAEVNFDKDAIVDSIIFYFKFDPDNFAYGNKSAAQAINIYELKDTLVDLYYHSFDPSSLSTELVATTSFKASNYDKDTVINDLSIALDKSFGERLVTEVDNWNGKTWSKYFYGFLVSPGATAVNASVSLFDLQGNSKVSLYFRQGNDTLKYDFNIAAFSKKFSMLNHNYDLGNILADLDNPGPNTDSVVYIQGAAGLNVKIEIPGLDDIKKDGKYGVNRAELVLNTESALITEEGKYPNPESLILLTVNDDENLSPLEEYFVQDSQGGSSYSGASYKTNRYVFDITLWMQKFLRGELNNNGFVVMLNNGDSNPSRVVLNGGGKHPSKKMKLVLSLTELPD